MASGYYDDSIRTKKPPRKTGTRKITTDRLLSLLLLSLKTPAYLIGLFV